MKAKPKLFDLRLPKQEAFREKFQADLPEHLPHPSGHTPIVRRRPRGAEAPRRWFVNTAVPSPAHGC